MSRRAAIRQRQWCLFTTQKKVKILLLLLFPGTITLCVSKWFILMKHLMHVNACHNQITLFSVHVNNEVGISNDSRFWSDWRNFAHVNRAIVGERSYCTNSHSAIGGKKYFFKSITVILGGTKPRIQRCWPCKNVTQMAEGEEKTCRNSHLMTGLNPQSKPGESD